MRLWSRRNGRGEGNDLSGGEVPAFKGLQHFTADGAGSSHNSDNEFFSDMVSSILEQKRKASEHVIFARRSTFI